MDVTDVLHGAAAGVGALAGLLGTAAMTVSSTLEAKSRGRGSWTAPARRLRTRSGLSRRARSTSSGSTPSRTVSDALAISRRDPGRVALRGRTPLAAGPDCTRNGGQR